jgi:His-Xaa-Ser system radical SAM maturase HxsB
MTPFRNRETFTPTGYELLPFRFCDFDGSKLLVNDAGDHVVISDDEFSAFVQHRLAPDSTAYLDLLGRNFLCEAHRDTAVRVLSTRIRTRKAFLAGFTKLHILVVSLRCEHSCHYCQVSRVTSDRTRYDMSEETASRALDLVFRSPARELKIELQGGEPLLNFERIVQIVTDAETRAANANRKVDFVVTTNLALLDDAMLAFFRQHGVALSCSLDGPSFIHNASRPRPDGDSHERTVRGIELAREALGVDRVAALMTTTRLSLDHPREIVDEYVRLGFGSIFIRQLSPYGFAQRSSRTRGYTTDEFLDFYVRALDYIIELNARGVFVAEAYAQLLLTRMLTPMATGYVDLQSPAGAAVGVAVYNYDGDVYPSDEARMLVEMGDRSLRLGNVHRDSYEEIFGGRLARALVANSCTESLPGCSDCAFQPFCGADPVFHYATQGDFVPHIPTSTFHRKHEFLIRHLLRLYRSSDVIQEIFWSWIDPRNAWRSRSSA